MESLSLSVFSRGVTVQIGDPVLGSLLRANYGEMRGAPDSVDLHYDVGRRRLSGSFFISRAKRDRLIAKNDGEFLYLFERDLSVQMQGIRRDLYFVHSAVLAFGSIGLMLVGTNKSGKSTTTWGLLHHGFRYLSEDLGAIDPRTLEVYPYPRALWLRRNPPNSYPLPGRIYSTGWQIYIPTNDFPVEVVRQPVPLEGLVFLQRRPGVSEPSLRSLSKTEAAARLLFHALNPGSHAAYGLDDAVAIASRLHSFELLVGELRATCVLLKDTFEKVALTNNFRAEMQLV